MSNYEHSWNKFKKREFQQRNRTYKREPNGNYKTEKHNNLNKLTWGLNNSLEMAEDRISVRSIEFTQLE